MSLSNRKVVYQLLLQKTNNVMINENYEAERSKSCGLWRRVLLC